MTTQDDPQDQLQPDEMEQHHHVAAAEAQAETHDHLDDEDAAEDDDDEEEDEHDDEIVDEQSDDDEEEEPSEDQDQQEQPEDQASGAAKPEAQLQEIVETAKSVRLTPAEEERAVQLLKQTVPGGPKALPSTLEAILTLPWSIGVKAVTESWAETKPAGRARLLTGLAKDDSDVSRRIRLSMARGLHAQDPASALKLIVSVCEAMGGAQGGSSTKDRQIFANVMLGKARPWLMNIPMAEMKPAEAHKLITPALESCAQAPIFTQIWVLRWICDAGKFESLPPEHIEAIGKSINRWQPRWRKELRKIITKLPEPLEAVLVDSRPSAPLQSSPLPPRTEAETAPAASAENELTDEELDAAEDAADEARALEAREQQQSSRGRELRPQDSRGSSRSSSRDRQPVQGPFDLTRSLRDIEAYVSRLRSDLQQAQLAARRQPAPDRGRSRSSGAAPASSEEMEEMRRFNHQLEEQNVELRHRIEELTSDHEDRAATLEISDSLQQFKTYLGLKLKEDYADYNAISREALNEVVRRHAHEILGRIFSVLQSEGVKFDPED